MTATTPTRSWLRRGDEPEWLVWLAVLVMLAGGLLLRTALEDRTARFNSARLSLSYPAGWTALAPADPAQLLAAADAFTADPLPAQVRVTQLPAAELSSMAQSLGDLAMAWSARQSSALTAYSMLAATPITAAGGPAIAMDYAYVVEATAGGLPQVAQAQDILLRRGDSVTVVTWAAPAADYARYAGQWRKVLASLEVK
jgi:hypothetical protein